jgi:hypothetical protein
MLAIGSSSSESSLYSIVSVAGQYSTVEYDDSAGGAVTADTAGDMLISRIAGKSTIARNFLVVNFWFLLIFPLAE